MSSALRMLAAMLCLAITPTVAWADAIDGNWCHNDGRRLSIRGQAIVTPSGQAIEGKYSRHWFSYVVPAPEPGAGDTILMTLLNENTIRARRGETAPENAEVWQRCLPSVSGLNFRRLL
jgi:hypothetical protein